MKKEEIKTVVRLGYAKVAKGGGSCCGPQASGCCGVDVTKEIGKGIGYSEEEMDSVPDGANLGLGCGNPVALASLKGGEVVLDLGSGAGFDCFLAAKKVGNKGKVIGIDMTPEMLKKARSNAKKGNYNNVEFRKGEIENLPVADNSVDVIISNCVINLSPDKDKVFKDAFRVLKLGGRLMVSDIVLESPLPTTIKNSINAYVGCIAGASIKKDYLAGIKNAGFSDIKIADESAFSMDYSDAKTIIGDLRISKKAFEKAVKSVASIKVAAIKAKR